MSLKYELLSIINSLKIIKNPNLSLRVNGALSYHHNIKARESKSWFLMHDPVTAPVKI